jgi:tetratricopeptide (TPR) repeat protein
MELGPSRVDARVKLAWDLFESGRDAEAEAEAREAVRLAPWEVAPLGAQALALVGLSRCDEAIVALGRAADLAAESLGSTEAREATKLLSDLEARCKDDRRREADVLGARAALAIQRDDAGAALRLLREAVDRDPDNLPALAELPGVERNLGHLEEALRFGGRYLSLAPEDPFFRRYLASIHRERGNFGLAEKFLREQIARFPKDDWGRMDLVDLLFETNRPSEARKDLKAFSGTAAPASALGLARARLGLLTGSDPDAAAMMKRAVMAEPHAFVETAAATAFAEAGVELETAAEWAQRARAERTAIAADAPLDAIGPDHADAGAQLLAAWGVAGRIAARRGQLAEAEALLEAAERAGAGPEVSAFLAETLAAAGRPEEAVQAAQRALAASPGQRLALRLAGPGRAAGGVDALAALRTLPLPGVTDLPARDLLVALGKDGKVLRIVPRDASPHPKALHALIGTAHGIAFPEDAPPFLVVPATVHCEASRCGVLLGRALGSTHGA